MRARIDAVESGHIVGVIERGLDVLGPSLGAEHVCDAAVDAPGLKRETRADIYGKVGKRTVGYAVPAPLPAPTEAGIRIENDAA